MRNPARDPGVPTDAGHQQEDLVVRAAEVHVDALAVRMGVERAPDAGRDAGFLGPDVHGARRDRRQRRLGAGKPEGGIAHRTVAAEDEEEVFPTLG